MADRVHISVPVKINQSTGNQKFYQVRRTHASKISISSGGPSSGNWTGQNLDEVQKISLPGAPTGGTFTLTFNGQTTGVLAYNSTPAQIQTALTGLTSIGANNATVTGPFGGGTPWLITFAGGQGLTNQPLITGDGTNLTGTANKAVLVTVVQNGAGNDTQFNAPPNGFGDPVNNTMIEAEAPIGDAFSNRPMSYAHVGTITIPADPTTSEADKTNRKIWRGHVFSKRIALP